MGMVREEMVGVGADSSSGWWAVGGRSSSDVSGSIVDIFTDGVAVVWAGS